MNEVKRITVYTTFDPTQLLTSKIKLEQEGISFWTVGENFGSLLPFCDGLASVQIQVAEKDVKRAEEILCPAT
jgi:hypothetical protein